MKFAVNSSDMLNILSKMHLITDSKGIKTPNVRFSRKNDILFIEYSGEEASSTYSLNVDFIDDNSTPFAVDGIQLLKLSQDFEQYIFSTDKNNKILTITADNKKLNIKLEIYSDEKFIILEPNDINITLNEEACNLISSFVKHAPKYVYKNDNGINIQFTTVRLTFINENNEWFMSVVACDSRNIISKKISLGNEFAGIQTKLYIPYLFFMHYNSLNLSNNLKIGIKEGKGIITLKDINGLEITHNTLIGDNFIDVENFISKSHDLISNNDNFKIRVDGKLFKKDCNYVSFFEDSNHPITFNINDKPSILFTGEFKNTNVRTLKIGKTDCPIIKVLKQGQSILLYEMLMKILDTMNDLTENGKYFIATNENITYFYNKEKTIEAIMSGLTKTEN